MVIYLMLSQQYIHKKELIKIFRDCLMRVRSAIKGKRKSSADEAEVPSAIQSLLSCLPHGDAAKMYESFIIINVSSASECLKQCLMDSDKELVKRL